jgi:hypothetical protein
VLDGAREAVGHPELVRLAVDRDLPTVDADAASWSAPSPTCWRTRSATAAAGPFWCDPGWWVRGSRSAWSTRARVFRRASGGGSSSRSSAVRRTARAAAPGCGWRSPRASSRPTAARSRSSR